MKQKKKGESSKQSLAKMPRTVIVTHFRLQAFLGFPGCTNRLNGMLLAQSSPTPLSYQTTLTISEN
jgi:hypothetical protein